MVKTRSAYLCNLKLLLLFLVVLGHSMEQVGMKGVFLYRFIYLFHMPLFAFVSGLHLKTAKACLRSARSAILLYLPIQGGLTLLGRLTGEAVTLTTPYWHLWYLLSLCWWSLLALGCVAVLERLPRAGKWLLLLVSLGAALLGGALPLGKLLSLSRTVVFFPYVLLGVFCPVEFQNGPNWKGRLALAAGSVVGILPAAAVLQKASHSFLYQANTYKYYHFTAFEGAALRLLCFLVAVGLGTLVLALTPAKRFPFTKIGGDTLPVYLVHTCSMPLLLWLWPDATVGFLVAFAVAVVVVIWELFRWVRPLYAVRGPLTKRTATRIIEEESDGQFAPKEESPWHSALPR